MLPLAERKEIIATHPRVSFHKKATPCTAFVNKRIGVRTWFSGDPERRKAAEEEARCKNIAHWRFKALKKGWIKASDGDYCWNHLFSHGLLGNMDEEAAFEKWYTKKYGDESSGNG